MSHVTSEVDQSLVVHTIDRVERGGSSDESSQEGSHMVWDWDPLGVQLCNFSTWGRLESVNLLAHLRGPSSSAGESPANRVEHSGPHRTVSADLAPEEAKESSSLTRIVVAGDSQGRLFALALLLLLRGVNEDELGLFRRKHQDWNATVAEANLW